MKNAPMLIALVLFLAACQPKKQEETTEQHKPIAADNILTADEVAGGWKLLFDGQSLTGWRIFKDKENDSWEVIEGTLHCKPFVDGVDNKRADLITIDQYDNFELAFDWKISAQGNSGVMFNVTEEFDEPYATGPEYQLLDDAGYPGELKPEQLTGANYDMHAVSENATHPVGEWNQSKIVVQHNQVEHWLNGKKVVEYELSSDDWNQRRATSKWSKFPGYGSAQSGHIDLQDHGNEVWFKNIKIKTL